MIKVPCLFCAAKTSVEEPERETDPGLIDIDLSVETVCRRCGAEIVLSCNRLEHFKQYGMPEIEDANA